MYAKLFVSMYDGTLAMCGPWEALVTFQQLLILSDPKGFVDMTPDAISRRTTIPIDIITKGLAVLEAPDPDSRTPDEEGRRILRLDSHRNWGWRIVNHEKFHAMRTNEERRDYMRNYQKERRSKLRKQSSTRVSNVTDAYVDVYVETEETHTHTSQVQKPLCETAQLPTACVPPAPNGLGGFVPDVDRFAERYPLAVNDNAQRYFVQIAKDAHTQDVLFRNLERWKGSDRWKRGIGIPTPENWIKNGDWKISPKDTLTPAGSSLPPGWQEALDELRAKETAPE
jgi:hypothetical protein